MARLSSLILVVACAWDWLLRIDLLSCCEDEADPCIIFLGFVFLLKRLVKMFKCLSGIILFLGLLSKSIAQWFSPCPWPVAWRNLPKHSFYRMDDTQSLITFDM